MDDSDLRKLAIAIRALRKIAAAQKGSPAADEAGKALRQITEIVKEEME